MRIALFILALLAGIGAMTGPAAAQTAEALRQAGQACELPDGYLRALVPAVQAAVDMINNNRRQVYQQRAAAQGVDVAAVGAVYAAEIRSQPNYRACP